jgi:hypothetical protein
MKKNAIIIFISLITFMSCKKDTIVAESVNSTSNTTPKWNERYIGNYKGTWTSQSYGSGVTGILNSKDTSIVIGVSSSDSSLTASLSNCSVLRFELTSNTFPIYHGKIYFRNDSMYYSCANGGLGGGNNETFKGKKL